MPADAAPLPRIWEILFAHALTLIGEIARHGRRDPFWTFGGGTALMLHYGHRVSKDIDIFVPDPQSLGFVTPRLSDVAESIIRFRAGRTARGGSAEICACRDSPARFSASGSTGPATRAAQEAI